MDTNNTKKYKSFNYIKLAVIITVTIIFLLIIVGCLLTWHTNSILLNYPTDSVKLKITRESLMNANTITFMVTLIVGLLASLLVYRIDKIEQLVNKNERLFEKINNLVSKNVTLKKDNQNLKKKIDKAADDINDISKAVKFDIILTYIENILNTAYLMNNITHIVISQGLLDFKQVGHLCSRIDPIRHRIQETLNREELPFSKITLGKKDILNTYMDEILGILEETSSSIKNYKKTKSPIFNIIDTLKREMKDIKDKIDKMTPVENIE